MANPAETWIDWLGLGWLRHVWRKRWVGRLAGVIIILLTILVAILLLALLIDFGKAVLRPDPDGTATRNIGLVLAAAIGLPFLIWRSWVAQRLADTGAEGLVTDRINAAVASLGAEKTVKRPEAEGGERTVENIEVRVGAILALERIARQDLGFHIQIMEILCAYIRINAPAEKAEPAPDLPDYPEIGPKDDAQERWAAWRWDVEQLYHEFRENEFRENRRPRRDIQTALTVLGRRSARQRAQEARGSQGDGDGVFLFDTAYPQRPSYPTRYSFKEHEAWQIRLERYREEAIERTTKYSAYGGYRLDLRNSNLRFYDLSNGCWNGASLSGAHLHGAKMDSSQMRGVDLQDAQLQSASLLFTELQGSNLMGSQLQLASLDFGELQGAQIMRVELEGAILPDARLDGVIRIRVKLLRRPPQISDAIVDDLFLRFTGDLRGADLQRACIPGALLKCARIEGAKLRDAEMQGADLRQARMRGANLQKAQMQGADLTDAQMQGADLRDAEMQGVQMLDTVFDAKTRFRPVSLRGAGLHKVDLSAVSFKPAILEGSFGDGTVTLPEGMERPAGWAAEELDDAAFAERWAYHRAALDIAPER